MSRVYTISHEFLISLCYTSIKTNEYLVCKNTRITYKHNWAWPISTVYWSVPLYTSSLFFITLDVLPCRQLKCSYIYDNDHSLAIQVSCPTHRLLQNPTSVKSLWRESFTIVLLFLSFKNYSDILNGKKPNRTVKNKQTKCQYPLNLPV